MIAFSLKWGQTLFNLGAFQIAPAIFLAGKNRLAIISSLRNMMRKVAKTQCVRVEPWLSKVKEASVLRRQK